MLIYIYKLFIYFRAIDVADNEYLITCEKHINIGAIKIYDMYNNFQFKIN